MTTSLTTRIPDQARIQVQRSTPWAGRFFTSLSYIPVPWILGPSNCTPLNLHVTLDDVQVAEREQTEPPHVLEGLEPVARPLLHLDGAVGASAPSSVPDIAPICRRRGLLRAARGELLPLPLPA